MLTCACVMLPLMASAQQRVLSLDECRALSAENDPYEKNARLDVLAAKAQKQEALAAYFPSVSATAAAYHALHPLINIGVTDILGTSDNALNISNYVDEMAPQYDLPTRYKAMQYGNGATVSVTQPIFAGGRIVNGNKLASLGVEAAELKASLKHRQNDEVVGEKYWRVVSLQEKQKTLADARNTLDSLEKDVTSALAAGILTESELMQVRLKSSELRSLEIQVRGGIRLAKMDLFNAIGVEYSALSASADSLRPHIDSILMADVLDNLQAPDGFYIDEEELAASMEETRLLELQVRANDLQKKMAMGEAMPEVGVGAMYGYGQYIGAGRTNGAVYAVVRIPLSDWGKTSKKMKRYDYELQKAQNEQDYLDAQLILRARQLWVDLNTEWERLLVAQESVDYARDVYERQLIQLSAGMVTMSDLLQTQTSLRQSEDSYIDRCIAYKTALDSYLALRK